MKGAILEIHTMTHLLQQLSNLNDSNEYLRPLPRMNVIITTINRLRQSNMGPILEELP